MKRIYNYLFLAILALTACNDDFLDRTPLDKVTDDKFWETEDHVRAAANAGYAGLIGKDMINMGECLADNVMWYQLNAWRQIGSGLYGSDLSTLNSRWSDSYTYIRRANYFLENYNRAVSVPVEVRERYAAEVKFHRAFQYWLLTSFFGDVPYITKALTVNDTEELYKSRTPRSQVIDSIMNDLETSYKYLPEYIEPASKEFGRITQAAQLALLARIALQNHRYPEAESAAQRVIELNKYSIYTTGKPNQDYYDLFTFNGRASRKSANKETILAYVYNYDLGQTGTKHNLSRELQVPDQEVRFQPTRGCRYMNRSSGSLVC
ncbi:MAG TPA: RagB/SusD family nutrient uptake outer membrane protein [Bacteroidales bacterium]|nr:RagB/SusD family nutrient uptake outer membrane protein [Bacteroidales bacterium]